MSEEKEPDVWSGLSSFEELRICKFLCDKEVLVRVGNRNETKIAFWGCFYCDKELGKKRYIILIIPGHSIRLHLDCYNTVRSRITEAQADALPICKDMQYLIYKELTSLYLDPLENPELDEPGLVSEIHTLVIEWDYELNGPVCNYFKKNLKRSYIISEKRVDDKRIAIEYISPIARPSMRFKSIKELIQEQNNISN